MTATKSDIALLAGLKPVENINTTATTIPGITDMSCSNEAPDQALGCRDDHAALKLKGVAIVVIFVGSASGVLLPILGRRLKQLRPDSDVFFVTKVFAAGVILATGFVHVLPEGHEFLTHPRLDPHPWRDFPFTGFMAMCATFFTLAVHFAATQYYENKHVPAFPAIAPDLEAGGGQQQSARHLSCGQGASVSLRSPSEEKDAQIRKIVVSQVLELGIVTHSIIIGVGMGVSSSPCSLRPLIAVLVFHQLFEGFALGGCITMAAVKTVSALAMALFFAATTPVGIAIGMVAQTRYDASSQAALIVQGTFNSVSAGILIYMALVDLIATDFLSSKLRSNVKLQVSSYIALFTGSGLTSLMARVT